VVGFDLAFFSLLRRQKMPRSVHETEAANFQRLMDNYSRLKNDRDHRERFKRHLEQDFIRGVDKPETYDQLERAYLNWR